MADSDSDSEEEILDITTPEVLAKYRLSAEIANRTLKSIAAKCTEGTSILELCCLGDDLITEECSKVHNKGKAKVEAKDKGVAFPTCISVNEIAGHNSAQPGDDAVLAEGDLVKMHYVVVAAMIYYTVARASSVANLRETAPGLSRGAPRWPRPGGRGR
jgi:methionine aminopeptidase